MVKAEGKITDVVIGSMMNWHHSGFNEYCSMAICPPNEEGLEILARYIIRASFAQERMTYVSAQDSSGGAPKVISQSKDAKTKRTFEALDWLAQQVNHIPNKGEQMVRYYGYYSNKSCGLRKKVNTDDHVPALIESDISAKELPNNWAGLAQKIYSVDPLLCLKYQGSMKISSFIEDGQIIKKILRHHGPWETSNHDPPAKNNSHIPELIYDYSYSQFPRIDYWLQ